MTKSLVPSDDSSSTTRISALGIARRSRVISETMFSASFSVQTPINTRGSEADASDWVDSDSLGDKIGEFVAVVESANFVGAKWFERHGV